MEVRVHITDEASKPAEHILRALTSIDEIAKKLTSDLRPLAAAFKSLAPAIATIDSALISSNKNLIKLDSAGSHIQATLRKIEDQARKTGRALAGIHGPSKGGGGHGGGGHKEERAEGLFGQAGGFAGSLFLTGPLGVFLGTVKELGEAFDSLADKVIEETTLREREVAGLASAGVRDPEAYREKIEEQAHNLNVPRESLLAVAEPYLKANFVAGTSQSQKEDSALYISKQLLALFNGLAGPAAEAAQVLATASYDRTSGGRLKKGQDVLFSRLGVKPGETAEGVIKKLEKFQGEVPKTLGGVTDVIKEISKSFFDFKDPSLIEALGKIKEALDPVTIRAFSTEFQKMVSLIIKAGIGISNLLPGLQSFTDYLQVVEKGFAFFKALGKVNDLLSSGAGEAPPKGLTEDDLAWLKSESKNPPPGFDQTKLPKHAEGGITTRDHQAEVHRDEVIMPLSKAPGILTDIMRQSGSSSGNRSVTVQAGAITIQVVQRPGENSEQLSQRLAELVPLVLTSAIEQLNIQKTGGIP